MQIVISGQDRTADFGAEIRQAGHALQLGDLAQALTPEMRLLAWQQTSTQDEYQRWIDRQRQLSGNESVLSMQRPSWLGAKFLRIRVMPRKFAKGWLHGTRPPDVDSAVGALTLREATSESDFTHRLIGLMKHRDNFDSSPFVMPRRPGTVGAVMARFRIEMWRQLRFLVDRVAFRQNHINVMLTRALEFEHEQRMRETEALQKRVAELEARLK